MLNALWMHHPLYEAPALIARVSDCRANPDAETRLEMW